MSCGLKNIKHTSYRILSQKTDLLATNFMCEKKKTMINGLPSYQSQRNFSTPEQR